jgi:hypothetical protein
MVLAKPIVMLKAYSVAMGQPQEEELLETSRAGQVCPICKVGKVTPETSTRETLTIYGRKGTRQVKSSNYRCNNRNKASPCRAGLYPGYITTHGHIIFDDDVLEREVLVTSEQTGFDIEYLNELAHRVQRQNVTFESEADVFNDFHTAKLPYDVMKSRVEVDRRRISEAYFLYIYLEAGQRHNIKDFQVIFNGNLEETILRHKSELKQSFEERWTIGHECETPGCRDVMVIDGGLTPHRAVCAAKLSGIKVFEEADISYLIGCPKMPINESKFCHEHKNCETPIVAAKEVSESSKKNLRSFKNKESSSTDAKDDDFFVVEKVLEVKKENEKVHYKVKWVGFPESESTWEPEENIPGFIKKFYEDKSKIGKTLPSPTIKHTKTVGGVKHHYLKWGDAEGDWVSDDFFKIISEDGEIFENHQPTCNTRKSRDKRVKRHTVGLLIGASPCGVVRLVEELYGCEAISQVYGIVMEHLGKLSVT